MEDRGPGEPGKQNVVDYSLFLILLRRMLRLVLGMKTIRSRLRLVLGLSLWRTAQRSVPTMDSLGGGRDGDRLFD